MKTEQPNTEDTYTIKKDPTYWEEHIKAQQASGLSRAQYCRINGVNYGRFGYKVKTLKCHQPSQSILPIYIKPEHNEKFQINENKMLCKLTFKDGIDLYVHDREILTLLLERMM